MLEPKLWLELIELTLTLRVRMHYKTNLGGIGIGRNSILSHNLFLCFLPKENTTLYNMLTCFIRVYLPTRQHICVLRRTITYKASGNLYTDLYTKY